MNQETEREHPPAPGIWAALAVLGIPSASALLLGAIFGEPAVILSSAILTAVSLAGITALTCQKLRPRRTEDKRGRQH